MNRGTRGSASGSVRAHTRLVQVRGEHGQDGEGAPRARARWRSITAWNSIECSVRCAASEARRPPPQRRSSASKKSRSTGTGPSGVSYALRVAANGSAMPAWQVPRTTKRSASERSISSRYAHAYVGPPRWKSMCGARNPRHDPRVGRAARADPGPSAAVKNPSICAAQRRRARPRTRRPRAPPDAPDSAGRRPRVARRRSAKLRAVEKPVVVERSERRRRSARAVGASPCRRCRIARISLDRVLAIEERHQVEQRQWAAPRPDP